MPESISDDLLELRTRVRRFVRDELTPRTQNIATASLVPDDLARALRERSRELGLFQLTQPRAYGGSEAGPLTLTVALEALAAETTLPSHEARALAAAGEYARELGLNDEANSAYAKAAAVAEAADDQLFATHYRELAK